MNSLLHYIIKYRISNLDMYFIRYGTLNKHALYTMFALMIT